MFVVGYMIEIQYIKLNFLFSTNLKFGIIHLIILSLILKNYLILFQLFIKMYKLKKITAFFLIVLPVFWGCNNDVNDSVVPADGVRAVLLVQHHGIPIPNASVFLKIGTLVFPGTDTTLYDSRFVTDLNGQYIVSGLPNGQQAYTFYAKGIDPGWDSTNTTPVWGYQFLMTDTRIGELLDYAVSIPVSE